MPTSSTSLCYQAVTLGGTSPAIRSLLLIHAVLSFLIDTCLGLRITTAKDIERHWQMPPDEVLSRGIRSCPSWAENIIISAALQERFGDDVLRRIDGFYQYDNLGRVCFCKEEWANECRCHIKHWRIDIDERLSARGIIVPIRDPQFLLIEGLRIFRSAQDARGFIFRLRADERQIAA